MNIFQEIKVAPRREIPILLVGCAVGAASGVFFAKKRYEKVYRDFANHEVSLMRDYYQQLRKEGDYSDPQVLAAEYEDTVDALDYNIETVKEVDVAKGGSIAEQLDEAEKDITRQEKRLDALIPEDVANIFKESKPKKTKFDPKKEERNPESPYVISKDEFMTNEPDYQQTTLSYFEEDDVLSDEHDKSIEEIEATVGNDNLLRFGEGSEDNNVVYVRNDRIELDFEILRHKGSYAKEVLGFIEHADKRSRIRKFRGDDE